MANSVSHARLPYPIINARFTVAVPFLDADGDPTDPTTPDTEISQDGGSFADAAEEVTTITGSNGAGYITLTGAEMNNSLVVAAFKVASGPKATLMTLYPRNLPILESGTAGAGASGTITLASGTYTGLNLAGCFIRTTGGTGGGGTGGANNQARRITSYNTSTRVATVTPNWETTPDNTTTYDVLLPEGVMVPMLTALAPTTLARTLVVDAAGLADANMVKAGPSGSGTAQTAGDITALITAVDDYVDAEVAAIKAKTDNLPSDPADASDIAAAFSTVNSTLATIAAYIDTEVAAIKAKTDNLPSDPADASDIAASFSSLASTLSTIAGYIDTEVAAIKAKTDNLPADPADASDIAAEFVTVNSTLATLAGYIDTEVAAIKAKTDNLPTDPADQSAVEAAIASTQSALTTLINAVDDFVDTEVAAMKAVTDKLNTMLQTSGANYQFTTDALENAPAGGGGGGGDTYILSPVFAEFVPRVQEFNATLYVGDTAPVTLVVYTVDPETGVRTATDLDLFASLYLRIEDPRRGEVQTVENADLTIDGSSNNELTFSPSEATVSSERQLKAALRTDDTEDQVVAIGTFTIKYAPRAA